MGYSHNQFHTYLLEAGLFRKRVSIKVRVDSEEGIVGRLEDLRRFGYQFETFHSRGGDVFDLKVLFDAREVTKPLSEVPGVIIVSSDLRKLDPAA